MIRTRSGRAPSWPTRLSIVMALFLMAGALLVARLVKIQLVDHARFADLAEAHQVRREALAPVRGRILASDGQVLAFTSENASIFARREEIEDVDAVVAALDSWDSTRERFASGWRPTTGSCG